MDQWQEAVNSPAVPSIVSLSFSSPWKQNQNLCPQPQILNIIDKVHKPCLRTNQVGDFRDHRI